MTETTSAVRPAPPPPPGRDWALFLDIDGTLLDIADRPDRVAVPAGLRDHLAGAAGRLDGALALVSGRPLSDIDRLFDPLRLPASGQHGGEWRPAAGAAPALTAGTEIPAGLRALAEALAGRHRGMIVEQKSHALALHYRHDPALGPALGAELAAALEGCAGLMLMPGRLVWEIKDASQSKGTAVGRFMALPGFAGRRPVFIGDDRTDEDGFRAALELGGFALPVGRLARSGEPGFADAAAVRDWLAGFAGSAA
ncbi:trehalose-phosphatase [Ferrovibrio xuzhouensis]|uniref:Trehalose 6-phosphate phosphatase n=1 Tax=Ferrovibrio xuzhouensis TaxID=1576914 RepID=A0ABV7VFM8_9PROT